MESSRDGRPPVSSFGSRVSSFLLVVLIAGLLLAGAAARLRLLAVREAAGLKPLEVANLPPVGAASVVLLGGFRGVAVDILWLQAISYHERRQYVEERAVIELITQIQPHFVSVWAFQAMVIAYDIPPQEPDPAQQWPWVKDGADFLKKGLDINPTSGDLWFYYGWIYSNKMSQDPYFEDACERDMGVNNYEEAARAYDRSRKLPWGPECPIAPRVVQGQVFFCYLQRAQQILRRATLRDDLSFPPEALAQAERFAGLCRAEADALLLRNPADKVYETFPARVALIPFDGYLAHIARLLAEGGFGEQALGRARKVLDKALSEMDNTRSKYPGPRVEWTFRSKTADAWTRIPLAIVRHVGERMDRPDVPDAEKLRCKRLLETALRELERVPEGVRSARDVVSLTEFVRRALTEDGGEAPGPHDDHKH